MKGLVVAGTRSGVGKTVATLTIMRALQNIGQSIQPAKAGPDFIDTSHHSVVAEKPSRTLDCWLQETTDLHWNYHQGEGDICIVEGVMGLYDGDASSTAMVAEELGLPVVLVVDGNAGMESVAATSHGFRDFAEQIGRDVDVVGVVAQRTHGGRHEQGIRNALPNGLEFVGRIPPDNRLEIPDRHLGLHSGAESPIPKTALDEAAEMISTDQLLEIASEPINTSLPTRSASLSETPMVAVARDEAFRFIYPATMERLADLGAIRTFSPVAGDPLPPADAIYLPGGYPELHATALTQSRTMTEISDAAAAGTPIFGECGGFMALAETLTTVDEDRYSMAGVLPADVSMHDQYQALDHVELRARRDTPIAKQDTVHRGHEFHYSSATLGPDARLTFDVERGAGMSNGLDGLLEYRTLGTYAHVHATSGAFDHLLGN